MTLNSKIYGLILICAVICALFAPVYAANDLLPGVNLDSVNPVSIQSVIQPSDVTPIPEIPTIVTVDPTPIPTTAPVTTEATAVPTTQPTTRVTTEVTTEPAVVPPLDQPVVSQPVTSIPTQIGTPDAGSTPDTNETWSDPPLNTSTTNNPYYFTSGGSGNWVVNDSGHVWQLDGANSTINYNAVSNTFDNFGTGFAILINAPNVILDGMGAILNGGNNTRYGIIVNNQPASDYDNFTSPSISGISITNITLTGFTEAGIFFNNVIGNLPGSIASNITVNPAPDSNVGVSNSGNGIVLQNSQNIEVSYADTSNNQGTGISLLDSENNNLSYNTASGNYGTGPLNNGYGIYLNGSDYNNLTGNTANENHGIGYGTFLDGGGNGGNGYGIYLTGSAHNDLTGNNVYGNYGGTSGRQVFSIDTVIDVSGNVTDSQTLRNGLNGGSGYGIYLIGSDDNNLTGNTANGNYGGDSRLDVSLTTLANIVTADVLIFNRTITDSFNGGNGYGIFINGSNGNNLAGNTANGNHGGSNGNFIFYNTLNANNIENTDIDFTLVNVSSGGNGYGVYLGGSSGTCLSGNNVSGNYGSPADGTGADIYIDVNVIGGGAGDITVNLNNVNNRNGGYGIYLDNSPGNYLTGNNATKNYGGQTGDTNSNCIVDVGISDDWTGTSNVTINKVDTGRSGYGMYLLSSDRNTLEGNDAGQNGGTSIGGYGIYLNGSADNNLTGNVANENSGSGLHGSNTGSGYGIYLYGSDYNNLTGNTANGNHGGPMEEWNYATTVSIYIPPGQADPVTYDIPLNLNNDYNGGSGYGIYLNASHFNRVTGNTANGNYGGDSNVTVRTDCDFMLFRNSTVTGNNDVINSINGGNGYGIFVTGSEANNLTSNTVNDNYGGVNGRYDFFFDLFATDGGNSPYNISLLNVASGGNGYGVYIDNSSGNFLSGNHATGNHGSPVDGTGANYTINIRAGNGGTYTGDIPLDHIKAGKGGYGIYLSGSPGTSLEGNDATGNFGDLTGGGMGNCVVNITTGNGGTATEDPCPWYVNTGGYGYGIFVLNSGNTIMRDNSMSGNDGNFALYGNDESHYINDIDTTNLVNGKKVLYLRNVADLLVGPSSDPGTVYIINGTNVTLEDLQLDNNGIGAFLMNATGSGLSNITASHDDYGIVLRQGFGNTLSNNNASLNRQNGIILTGSELNTLINNTVTGNTFQGFVMSTSAGNTFINNTASRNGYSGFGLYKSNGNTLINNTATGNYGTWNGNGYGFYVAGSNSNTFSGNQATGNTGGNGSENMSGFMATCTDLTGCRYNPEGYPGNGYGFYLKNSDYNTLTGNTADHNDGGTGGSWIFNFGFLENNYPRYTGGSGYGISLTNSDRNNLTVNEVASNSGGTGGKGSDGSSYENNGGYGGNGGTGYGIFLAASNDNLLSGNNATGNIGGTGGSGGKGSAGLEVIYADGVNGSRGEGYGVQLEDSIGNYLAGNTADVNTNDGFRLIGSNYTNITMNSATGNHDDGFRLISSGYNNLTNNSATGNHDDGFRLIFSGYNNLTNNSASGNSDDGYRLIFSGYSNLTNNSATGNHDDGFRLIFSGYNNLTNNTASGNHDSGFRLIFSGYNNLTGNNVAGNLDGISLDGSGTGNLTGNYITGNTGYGLDLNISSDNKIYNNYFNNTRNVYVSAGSTGNSWNITPTAGTNIVGGPNLGGNYWADPNGTGWSQTHPDTGMGFTEPYNITGSTSSSLYQSLTPTSLDIDRYPLVKPTPILTPTQSGSSGPYDVVIQPVTAGTLPYDATFTGNDIPQNLQSCHSYTVGITVKNTGTMNWSSLNGVVLVPFSTNGFTFNPTRCTVPEGTVIQPGQSYTFPVMITVPCPMTNGTYQLRFKMAYTVRTTSGTVEVPFGDVLTDSIAVGAKSVSEAKSGVKAFTPSGTHTGVAGRFTTTIPGTGVANQVTAPVGGYFPGTTSNKVTTTISRNFNTVTGLLWTVLLPD